MSYKKFNKKIHMYSKTTKGARISFSKKIYLFPIIFVLSILPFITRYYEYNTGLSIYNWYSAEDKFYDIFLYYKHVFIIIIASFMLIILVYNHTFIKKFKFNKSFYPLLIYSILAILSSLLSKYTKYSLSGIFEQFESLFVILGYFIIAYYSFTFIENFEDITYIFKYLKISILILSLLGLTQIIGHNFLLTDFGKKLMISSEYWNQLENFNIGTNNNIVSLTLYNPNYVGVYTSFLLPIFLCLLISTKGFKNIIYILATILGLFMCLIGSGSKAGLVGLFTSLLFILLLYRKYIFRHYMKYISAILIIILGIILTSKLDSIKHILTPKQVDMPLSDIITEDKIIFTYNNNQLYFDYEFTEDNELIHSLTDVDGKEISHIINSTDNSITITDERFLNFKFSFLVEDNRLYIISNIDAKNWIFTKLEDDTFYYVNRFGKFDKIVTAKSSIFTGYEKFATGRGYIWSRTIPLLNDYIFIGSGPDTFAIVYPQQDYVNLHNFGFGNQILTKPHSLYLQIGVQTGVLSLIAFILFYILYFVQSIKIFYKGIFETPIEKYGIAIFIGTISYMITGISNDSSITVSPTFWVLIGLGLSINYKVLKQNKKFIK